MENKEFRGFRMDFSYITKFKDCKRYCGNPGSFENDIKNGKEVKKNL